MKKTLLILLLLCFSSVYAIENIKLIDGSDLHKISDYKMIIEKGDTSFTINSTVPRIEIGDISKTQEWGYDSVEGTTEYLKSNKPLRIEGEYICVNEPKVTGKGLGRYYYYENCVHYPLQLKNITFGKDFIEQNIRNLSLVNPYLAKIDIGSGFYDPTITNLTTGMLGCWDFENNLIDEVNGYNGTDSGGLKYNSEYAQVGSYSLDLNGSESMILDAHVSNFPDNANTRTLMIWARNNNTASGTTGIFGYGAAGNGNWFMLDESGKRAYVDVWGSNIYDWDLLNQSDWTMITGTYDGSQAKLYVNDYKHVNGSLTANTVLNEADVGANPSEEYFWGQVDMAVMWNRELNLSEVQWAYYNGAGRNCSQMMGTNGTAAPPAPPKNQDYITITPDINLTGNDTSWWNWSTGGNYSYSEAWLNGSLKYNGSNKFVNFTGLLNNTGYLAQFKDFWNGTLWNESNRTFTTAQNAAPPGCINNIVNTTWSSWADMQLCQLTDLKQQNRSLIEYDANNCGNVSNVTHWDYQNTSCNYCSYNIIYSVWSNWTINNLSCGYRNRTSFDANFSTCCNITSLSADCYLNDTSTANYTYNHTSYSACPSATTWTIQKIGEEIQMLAVFILCLGSIFLLFYFAKTLDGDATFIQPLKLFINLSALVLLVASIGLGLKYMIVSSVNAGVTSIFETIFIVYILLLSPVILTILLLFSKEIMQFYRSIKAPGGGGWDGKTE